MFRKSIALALLVATLVTQTGCYFSMSDAAMSGVYDFVSGSVTNLLMNLVPVSNLVGGG